MVEMISTIHLKTMFGLIKMSFYDCKSAILEQAWPGNISRFLRLGRSHLV